MAEQWYISKEGKQYGPYSWEELTAFAGEGRIGPEDNIWNSSMAAWRPAGEVPGLLPAAFAAFVEGSPGEEGPSSGVRFAQEEEILGIIPALNRRTGLFSVKTYTLIVTNRRLIFALLTSKMMQAAVAEANEASKGKGMLARMKEALTSQQRIYSRYYNMTGEEILRENPENFAVNNDEIKTVKIHIGHFYEAEGKKNDTMVILTAREKLNFSFHYDGATGEAKKILWRALGNRVK